MNKTTPIQLIIFAVALICGGLLFALFQKEQNIPAPPVISQAQDFELIDSTNHPFGSAQLKGKIWIAQFFFTTCSGICPITTGKMAMIYRSYNLNKKVAFVSITVNPDNDTPEVLTKYSQKYHADTKQWHFLTGPIQKIEEISVKNFKIGNVEEPVFHSGYFVLVDALGRIRGYYNGTDMEGTKNLFRDISVLLKEKI